MKLFAALVLLLALAPADSQAKTLPRYGTFAYSNVCWEKESGDAAGARFSFTRSRKGATLVYEYGNGGLNGARITRLKVVGDTVEAEAETGDGDLSLSATLGPSKAELSSHFAYETGQPPEHQVLKRVKSLRQ